MTTVNHEGIDRSIALIGYRGSGKTTVGRELASILNVPLIDTDEMVARRTGKTICEIFAEEGESGFRVLEKKTIGEIDPGSPAVISVGGGAMMDSDNVAALRRIATVVWLTASAEVLVDRIDGDSKSAATRPALTNESPRDEVIRLLGERNPHYQQAADHTVDTDGQTPTQVTSLVLALVRT